MSDDNPKSSKGKSTFTCTRCGGSGSTSETYQAPMDGASRDYVTRTRQVTCVVCGGRGYT